MIKLMKSSFYNEAQTKQKLLDFLASAEILSMNAECKKFEQAFAMKQERAYAVMVNSGSTANLVLLQAMLNLGRLQKGDRVGFSALTWATNVMPLVQLGLVPVPLDCEPGTLNVSPEKLAGQIQNLKAVFLTNVLGFSDNISGVEKLCKDSGVILLEDNCESLGSRVGGKLLGNFGIASTFSFFVGHHLSTIEGGMVCTDDEELADMITLVRAHGWDRNLSPEKQKKMRAEAGVDEFYAKYTFYDLAYGVRPTEISGVLGNEQLQYWDEIVQKREANFKRYQEAVAGNDDFLPLNLSHMDTVSNFAFPVICKDEETSTKYKAKFAPVAEIRPVIAGNMTNQPFYKKYGLEQLPCPNSDQVHTYGFYIPNNPELTEEEITQLCTLLKN